MALVYFRDGTTGKMRLAERKCCMSCAYFSADPLSDEQLAMDPDAFAQEVVEGDCKRRYPAQPVMASDWCGDFAAGMSGQSQLVWLSAPDLWDALDASLRADDDTDLR